MIIMFNIKIKKKSEKKFLVEEKIICVFMQFENNKFWPAFFTSAKFYCQIFLMRLTSVANFLPHR
jgi:hypothetical protein